MSDAHPLFASLFSGPSIPVVLGLLLLVMPIRYILTLTQALKRCSPAARTMEPASVWLLLIPVFNLIWNFIVVLGMAKSLSNEFARRGISSDAEPGKTWGLAMCILALLVVVPAIGIIFPVVGVVCWGLYWFKIATYSELLASNVGISGSA